MISLLTLHPDMPTLDTAMIYPGTCMFEGTSISEGRGTTRPFEVSEEEVRQYLLDCIADVMSRYSELPGQTNPGLQE